MLYMMVSVFGLNQNRYAQILYVDPYRGVSVIHPNDGTETEPRKDKCIDPTRSNTLTKLGMISETIENLAVDTEDADSFPKIYEPPERTVMFTQYLEYNK